MDRMTGKKPKSKDNKNKRISVANDQLGENAGNQRILNNPTKRNG